MRKARLLISGTHVQKCFPLLRAESTHRFFPKRVLFGILMKPTHPSVLVPDAQEVAIWEVQDDTWVGRHRQGLMEVAGPYSLDGSACNPEIVELRRAGWRFAVLEPPEPSTQAVEPTCEPKLLIGRFGCIAGDHTVPHAEHISLLRAAQHATRFWKDDGSVLCFVSACQLVVDSWKR